LRVLTKPDLADPKVTERWLEALKNEHTSTLQLVATHPKSAKRLVEACRRCVPKRGQPGFPVRVMIAGIPNVGKSTLFNLLAGKRKAVVRDQPAVTRSEQQIEVPGGLLLVDTPGVLWPKLDDQRGAHRLAMSGAIRDTVYDAHEVARFAVAWLMAEHPLMLRARFKLDRLAKDPDQVLEQIAKKRGCLTRGVGPDLTKASELLLGELRAARLGPLSFETPEDFASNEEEDEDTEDQDEDEDAADC